MPRQLTSSQEPSAKTPPRILSDGCDASSADVSSLGAVCVSLCVRPLFGLVYSYIGAVCPSPRFALRHIAAAAQQQSASQPPVGRSVGWPAGRGPVRPPRHNHSRLVAVVATAIAVPPVDRRRRRRCRLSNPRLNPEFSSSRFATMCFRWRCSD